jgi:hypothetical protein
VDWKGKGRSPAGQGTDDDQVMARAEDVSGPFAPHVSNPRAGEPRSLASALTGPPAVPVPPAGRAPWRERLPRHLMV